MFPILLWVIVFIISIIILVKSSEYFTNSAERVGIHYGIPAFVVGITIVAIGTSLPELVSSIFAIVENSSEIVVGNVIGSNITNLFLVLGIAAIIGKKLKVSKELLRIDIPFLLGSTVLFALTIFDGVFTIFEAMICVAAIVLYFIYMIRIQKKDREIKKEMEKEMRKKKLDPKVWITLAIGALLIFFSAKYTIESVIVLSSLLNVGKEVIAASAVALGTSLPELVVSIVSAKNKKPEIAVGNILGSNIFNALAVMGIPAFIGTMMIPNIMISFALPMFLFAAFLASVLVYFFITHDRKITRMEGIVLVILYIIFIGKIIGLF